MRQDLAKAEALLQRAAEEGSVQAALRLAEDYRTGGKNKAFFKYVSIAAERGDQGAQKILSKLYFIGHGCARDAKAGRLWMRRAEPDVLEEKMRKHEEWRTDV